MCYRYIFELKYYVASTKIFFSLFYQHRIIAPKLSWSKNKTLWTFIKSRVYTSYYRIYTFVHCAMRIWRILHALNTQSSIVFFSAGTPNPLTILDVNHICQLSSRTILYKYPAESNAGINRIYRREARYSYTDPDVVFIGVYYPELLYEQETGYPTTLLHCSVGRDRSFLHSIVKLHNISDSMIKFSTTHCDIIRSGLFYPVQASVTLYCIMLLITVIARTAGVYSKVAIYVISKWWSLQHICVW